MNTMRADLESTLNQFRADAERYRADAERHRADAERYRADAERRHSDNLRWQIGLWIAAVVTLGVIVRWPF